MFDISKPFETRDGRKVKIYDSKVYGVLGMEIHGAVEICGKYGGNFWKSTVWDLEGNNAHSQYESDLVNVKPRIKRPVWLNVYSGNTTVYHSKYEADVAAERSRRLACVHVYIDCDEGEGL